MFNKILRVRRTRRWVAAVVGVAAVLVSFLALWAIPTIQAHRALRLSHTQDREWPVFARVIGAQSATPVMLGNQLNIVLVARKAGAGQELPADILEILAEYKRGVCEWQKYRGGGPLDFSFEVQVVEITADPAFASEDEIIQQAVSALLGKESRAPFSDLLNYAWQRCSEEDWDGVWVTLMPERQDTAWAYINGPYSWYPLRNLSFRLRGGAFWVAMHETGHVFGALDRYGVYDPERVAGVDAVPMGTPRGGGIMAQIPPKGPPHPATLHAIFGGDSDKDGIPNPVDVTPEIALVGRVDQPGPMTAFRFKVSPGFYRPKNSRFLGGRNDRLVLIPASVFLWFLSPGEENWACIQPARVEPSDMFDLFEGEKIVQFEVPDGSRLAVQVTNTVGNSARWCWGPMPDPWPQHRIFLPLVLREFQ